MKKNKISKKEAIEIADEFYSAHYYKQTGNKKNFKAVDAHKSFTENNCWTICYDLLNENGAVMDGPVIIYVDENKKARFFNDLYYST